MSYEVKPGNIFGRLGQGLGQGISEQIPKEVERIRLSEGLNKLGQTAQNGSPYSVFSQLLSIPGMTEQKAQLIFPFLQQQLQRQEAAKRTQNNQQSNITAPQQYPRIQNKFDSQNERGLENSISTIPQERQPENTDRKIKSIVTPESTRAAQEVWREPSYDERLARATQLSDQNRATFPTPIDAMSEIDKRIQIDKDNFQARKQGYANQQQLKTEADQEFKKHIEEKLQKNLSDSYSQVWGDIQGELRENMYQDISDGMPVTDAASKYGKQALEIGKDMVKISELGSFTRYLKSRPIDYTKSVKRDLETTYRDKFKKMGKLEEYANIVQATQGLTPAYAASIAFPIKENKKNYDLLKSIKKPPLIRFGKYKSNDQLNDITDKLMENITKNDSILSYGLALKRLGFDENDFFNRVKNKYGKTLTPLQEKNLYPINESLGDIWLTSIFDTGI